MKLIDFLVTETLNAVDNLFIDAKKVPADKLEWAPLELGRSVLDQLQECAQAPLWGLGLLESRKFVWNDEIEAQFAARKATLTTFEACETACRANTARFVEAMKAIKEEEFTQIIQLPFGKSHDWTLAQVLNLHTWNCNYHQGQINYIQTLYGDKGH